MLFAQDPGAALWFLIGAAPICFYVAWSDLASMKIPNRAVLALVAVFAIVGALVLPLADYGWRWVHLGALLLFGMAANAAGAMGAGDAKFIAAAAPMVAPADALPVLVLLSGCVLVAVAAHRLARATALRRLAPQWESWSSGRRFPMGFPLAGTLALYLALAAAGV